MTLKVHVKTEDVTW